MRDLIGSTVWARQTLESDIFYKKPPVWFKIWFYIISKVNYKDTKQFKRGEGYFNFSIDKEELRWCTADQWKKCIHYLKTSTMISTTRSTRGMTIKVLNYAKFQDAIKKQAQQKAPPEAPDRHNSGTTEALRYKNNGNNGNNIVDKSTSIIINGTTYMTEELTYEPLEGVKTKTKYGRNTMAVLAKKYAELAGIELGKCFDASEWSKPLGSMYRYFGKDADKTMAYMEKAIKYFESKKLTYTPHTLARNKEMMDKWTEDSGSKDISERRKL